MERIVNGIGWVVFTFEDGTKQSIHTTMSKEILKELHVSYRDGALFDIEKNKFVPLREDAVAIDFYDEKPVFNQEVLDFASRFI